jgi:vacuolar-type H+-ATPase subunit H
MSSAIEETVKALVEFESTLEAAKAEVSDTRRRTTKDASDWAEAARTTAVTKAREISSRTLANAKEEAEAKAAKIRKKGESELRAFEASISKHKSKAAELVVSRLLRGTS